MTAQSRLEAVQVLAKACGAYGMVGGQVLDTVCDVTTLEGITQLNRLKTGVMISCAAELGCVASQMNGGMRQQAVRFADEIGLGFQIRDDILDVVGDVEVFGKPIGSDKEEGKVTMVDLLGLEKCRELVRTCSDHAKEAVKSWPVMPCSRRHSA